MSWQFDFTAEKLAECLKRNKNPGELFAALEAVLPRYEINTVPRVAAFLAQCGHESAEFTILTENLNYSGDALKKVWPRHFSDVDVSYYNRNPERIANRAYRDRMGNGNEASGDGWRYRGRGAIQLTGKSNYQAFAQSIGYTLDQAVAYLETLPGAVESAAWFWWKNGLNAIADSGDMVKMTKRINGGTLGLEDRLRHYEHMVHVLGGDEFVSNDHIAEDDPTANWPTLRRGSPHTEWVKAMQTQLGLEADGVFGAGTEQVLREWQEANGLVADGVAGRASLKKLLGYE